MINHVTYSELIKKIEADTDECRFVSRVFFVNNLERYYELVNYLQKKADRTIYLSDDNICSADDVVPDLSKVVDILRNNNDVNILIPSIGEYLRMGELIERDEGNLNTIISLQTHSSKRVWMPIFLSMELFQSVVGSFDERFKDFFYEVDGEVSEFCVTAYSTAFRDMPGVSANGLKRWLRLWDEREARSGMSYITRMARRISRSSGDYNLTVFSDPFEYICGLFKGDGVAFDKNLGDEEQWKSLLALNPNKAASFKELLLTGMNFVKFDAVQILGNWGRLSNDQKWYFYIWYKLGFSQDNDYICSAVSCSCTYNEIPRNIECHVYDCLDDTDLSRCLQLRKEALEALGNVELSDEFWQRFDLLDDDLIKMSLLCGRTRRERERIIDLISRPVFRDMDKTSLIHNYLESRYHDLAFYLSETKHIEESELSKYIDNYKINKIEDEFDFKQDDSAEVDLDRFDYRSRLLGNIKNSQDAYFQWIDGMGVEWIDLLIEKVQRRDPSINCVSVKVGKAILPTVTSVNMSKADENTITGEKFNELDRVSHIKDGSNRDYHSIIVRQFEIIDEIADLICRIARDNPGKTIVVTADHGMSRKAARAFHRTEGIVPPKNADVKNEGRYCVLEKPEKGEFDSSVKHISGILLRDNIAAFKTFNHFTAWGKAAGEIHGGALPEEILVPVICLEKKSNSDSNSDIVGYRYECVIEHDLYREKDGNVLLRIKMRSPAKKVIVSLNGKDVSAKKCDGDVWEATLSGLEVGKSYSINICPDDYIMGKETIHIKRRGLTVNDEDI